VIAQRISLLSLATRSSGEIAGEGENSMKVSSQARNIRAFLLIATSLIASAATGAVAAGRQSLLSLANDLGPVDASSPVNFNLWMKLRDQERLDALVTAQQAGTGAYLSNEQVRAQHAPTAADIGRVTTFLKSHGFTVKGVGQDNLFVSASGTVARVQRAFDVQLHRYNFHGRTFNASGRSATVPAELMPVVAAVGGLSDLGAEPQIARVGHKVMIGGAHRPADAEGLQARPTPLAAGANGLIFSAQCFFPPRTLELSGNGATATYEGNVYGAPITNTAPGTAAPCGYQPSDLHTAYNLNELYQEGLNGKGTTIAIVDAFGSTTIANDVQAFSQAMGLPPADLTIIGTPTESNFSTDANASWATETTLDVEWVHAIAPGAKIVLVVTPTNSFDDLFAGIVTASNVPGVVAISNSWSGFDIGIAGDSEFYRAADNVLKSIGAIGVSVDFSTGDFGNNMSQLGGLYTSTGWPASSPFATGVGGVSAVLDSRKQVAWQTSWGTNLTEVADTAALGSPPIDPPNNEGFDFGGTGGESDVYPQPVWQQGLPGNRRQTPDISWLADPFTGVEIIFTGDVQGDLDIEVIGGTSLACPIFTALYGIATQSAHHLLGQAAPRLYRLPPGAITDVTNVSSPNNVTGTIHDAGGTDPINSWELAAPLFNQPSFISALYNSPFSTRWFVITFGLDTTLSVGPGWDPATGLGTPNPPAFVRALSESR
jgi:subtilase family serine protease